MDLIPAPHTRSGVRYVVPHRSGKWRAQVRHAGTVYFAPGLFDRKSDAFHAAVRLREQLRGEGGK